MGIDDIQKTSGNAMAITMTADWVREVDALATPEFGALNAAQNRARVAAEPVPPEVAARYRVSALLARARARLAAAARGARAGRRRARATTSTTRAAR